MTCACPAMPPRMTSRLQIQKPNDGATPDAAGHVELSDDANWISVGSRPCNVFTRGGSEKWRFNQVSAEISRIVHFQYGPLAKQIQPRWRLRKNDSGTMKAWDVATAFIVDDAKKIIEVHCTEVV